MYIIIIISVVGFVHRFHWFQWMWVVVFFTLLLLSHGGDLYTDLLILMNVRFAHCMCTVISDSVATLHASVHRYRSVFLVEFKFGYVCAIRNDPWVMQNFGHTDFQKDLLLPGWTGQVTYCRKILSQWCSQFCMEEFRWGRVTVDRV